MSQEVVKFIRKSNDLVEAKYKFDIWETRIFTKMLTMIHREDEDFKEYRVYLRDIVGEFGLEKNKDAYECIRQGAKKLMKKTFYIPYEAEDGQKRMFETPVISSLDSAILEDRTIANENLYIGISFHPRMKPYLLQLKNKFTMYDVRNILKLPSVYSIRIYELLKQYENIGKRKLKIDELKDILGVESEYPLYANFKQRVINKAQKDMKEHTDIMFTFDEIKSGRAVTDIIFYIEENPNFVIDKQKPRKERVLKDTPKNVIVDSFDDIYPLIEDYVTGDKLKEWLKVHGEQKVKIAVKYLREKLRLDKKPTNPAAYLQKLLNSDDWFEEVSTVQKQQAQKKTASEENQARRRRVEEQIRVLRNEAYYAKVAKMNLAFKENSVLKTSVVDKVKSNLFSSYDEKISEAENLSQNPIFIAAVVGHLEKSEPQFFQEFEALYYNKISILERELR